MRARTPAAAAASSATITTSVVVTGARATVRADSPREPGRSRTSSGGPATGTRPSKGRQAPAAGYGYAPSSAYIRSLCAKGLIQRACRADELAILLV